MEDIEEKIKEIKKKILENEKKIFSKISAESISVYTFLKKEHGKGNIKSNTLFQFVFRSYYRLDNAGLGEPLKKRYFELLGDKEDDLEKILRELYKIKTEKDKNSVQFSFATKLLHTLDNEKPIFDDEVKKVIHIGVSGDKKKKIKSARRVYDRLEMIYAGLLKDKELKEVVLRFREKFKTDDEKEVSDIKALDFIVWSLGKLEKRRTKKLKAASKVAVV